MDPVLHVDELRRPLGRLDVVGDGDGEHVAGVGGATPDGDHHRPVGVDEAHPQLTRDVVCGEDPVDAGEGLCPRRVDGDDVGAGVVGEAQEAVEHARHDHVVDVAPVAEGEFRALVFDAALPDAFGQFDGRGGGSGGDEFDGLDDLGVAGAAAEVGAETAVDGLPVEVGALLVDERLGPHHDPRGAEAALERPHGGEGVGVAFPLGSIEALEGGDLLACGLLHRDETRHRRLAVEQYGAASALAAGGAPVLGRRHTRLVP